MLIFLGLVMLGIGAAASAAGDLSGGLSWMALAALLLVVGGLVRALRRDEASDRIREPQFKLNGH